MLKKARRGTSNSNKRGSTSDRRARKAWLMKHYAFALSPFEPLCASCSDPFVRCYRCGALLCKKHVTIDRIKLGKRGGKYTRDNIRPACANCNSKRQD